MRIWKFPIEVRFIQTIEMPAKARVLSLQLQNGKAQLWALVDEKKRAVKRTFAIYGTGETLTPRIHYSDFIGTFQTDDGDHVWHVFDLTEPGAK